MSNQYYIYMMTNTHHAVLYTGVTGNIDVRGWQHKQKLADGFTKRYNATKMVYFEAFEDVHSAIDRKKQLKGWSRKKKETLINSVNPEWDDVYRQAFR